MRLTRALTLAAVVLTTSAGCASSTSSPPFASSSVSASARPQVSTNPDSFTVRAGKLIAGWDGSPTEQSWDFGYVPLSDTVRLPAGAFHSGADKAAYYAGQFRLTVPLPKGPAQQTVRFDKGNPRTLPGLTPDAALRTESVGRCPTTSCPTYLTVTGAKPTTERVLTNRGEATVPAWSFRISGYQGEFVFAAVKSDPFPDLTPGGTPGPPPQLNGYQGAGLKSVSADGRTLTLGVEVGCGGAMPSGLVQESKSVVVIGSKLPPKPSPGVNCVDGLTFGSVTVHLSEALGARTVIDVGTGLPRAASTPPTAR
ncbi:hypothetical protein ABIA32_003648 [Streptacidiphilus sp. MAP12-20]|uniref:hypothetical protein n=1 Tax=Streptacidiphilus sp. MAP12-20 TaxID=3156299 RepID=UPI003511F8C0